MNLWDPSGAFTCPLKFASRGDHATYKVRVPSFPYSNKFLRLLSRRYLRLAMSSALCYWDYPDRLFHCQSLTVPLFLLQDPRSLFYRLGERNVSTGSGKHMEKSVPNGIREDCYPEQSSRRCRESKFRVFSGGIRSRRRLSPIETWARDDWGLFVGRGPVAFRLMGNYDKNGQTARLDAHSLAA